MPSGVGLVYLAGWRLAVPQVRVFSGSTPVFLTPNPMRTNRITFLALGAIALFLATLLSQSSLGQTAGRLTAVNYPGGFTCQLSLPVQAGGKLYYPSQTPSNGVELITCDSTLATAHMVRDIYPSIGGSDPSALVAAGGKVLFTASDGLTGQELYVSDGSDTGTHRLTDYVAGATGSFSTNDYSLGFGNWALFSCDVGGFVASDGTVTGTRHLLPSSNVGYPIAVGGRAILVAYNLFAPDSIFAYDYATNTATFLTTPLPGVSATIYSGNRPLNSIAFGNQFVIGFGSQILISDGTQAGSTMISTSGSEDISYAFNFAYLDGKVYFAATTRNHGREVHALDVQTRLITLAADVNRQNNGNLSSSPENLTVYRDTLFFLADSGFFSGFKLQKLKGSYHAGASDHASGTASLTGASLDTINGALYIGRAQSNDQSFVYRGQVQATGHSVLGFSLPEVRRESAVLEIPERSMRLVVFRTSNSGSDSLLQPLGDGRFRYYAPNQQFHPPSQALQDYVIAGSQLYLASGYTDFLWRLDDPVPTALEPIMQPDKDRLWPNPVSAGSSLRYSGESTLQDLVLTDACGRVQMRQKSLAQGEALSIVGLSPGIYLVQAMQSGVHFTCRIVISQ